MSDEPGVEVDVNSLLCQLDVALADVRRLTAMVQDTVPREDHNEAMATMKDRAQTLQNLLDSATQSKRQALRRAELAEKCMSRMIQTIVADSSVSTELRSQLLSMYAAP